MTSGPSTDHNASKATPRRAGRLRLAAAGGAVALALTGALGACGSSSKTTNSASTPATGNAVTIQNFMFMPMTLTVKVGTTVTWTNKDVTPHTVEFDDSSIPQSPQFSADGSQKTYSHTFSQVGTFNYICGIHNYMKGTIKVVQ